MLTLQYFFFFNDMATTEIYTLSLHDALPICRRGRRSEIAAASPKTPHRGRDRTHLCRPIRSIPPSMAGFRRDQKSTRLNSSHTSTSHAVFCLKKRSQALDIREDTTPDPPTSS